MSLKQRVYTLDYLIYTSLVIIALTVLRVNGTFKKNPFLPPAPAQQPVYYHPAPAPAPPPIPRPPPPQIYIVPVQTHPAPSRHPPPHPPPPPPRPVHPAPQPIYTHPAPQPKVIQPTFVIQPIIVKPVPVNTGGGGGGGKGGKGCKHCH